MKMNHLSFISILLITFLLFAAGCRSKKTSTRVVEMPCFGEQFWSTADNLIGSGTAASSDRSVAIRQANLRARTALAQKMQSTLEFATEEYLRRIAGSVGEDIKSKFRDYSLNYASVNLGFITTICDEMHQKRDGSYDYYVAVRANTDVTISDFERRLRDADIELEFDRQLFRQIYEDKIREYRENNW